MPQDSFEYEERVFSGCTWVLFIFLAIISFIFPPILIFSFPLGLALRATGKKRIVLVPPVDRKTEGLSERTSSTLSERDLDRSHGSPSSDSGPMVTQVGVLGLVSIARSKELLTVTKGMTENQITSRIGPPENRIVLEDPPQAIEKLMYHDDQFCVVMMKGQSAIVRNNTKTQS